MASAADCIRYAQRIRGWIDDPNPINRPSIQWMIEEIEEYLEREEEEFAQYDHDMTLLERQLLNVDTLAAIQTASSQ